MHGGMPYDLIQGQGQGHDLYLHTKFHSNRENFLWTDGRTDLRTYGRTNVREQNRQRDSANAETCPTEWHSMSP